MIYLCHLVGYLLTHCERVSGKTGNSKSGITSIAIERDASMSVWNTGCEVSRNLAALRSEITRS